MITSPAGAEWMKAPGVLKFLGLTVGVIHHGIDDDQRQAAYRADITDGTNSRFRVRLACATTRKFDLKQLCPACFAIVDEVDSILIDEARTPLIISGPTDESTDKSITESTRSFLACDGISITSG